MGVTMRVLVIDDDELTGSCLCELLERGHGSMVVGSEWVPTLAAAIARLKTPGIDVCLLDLHLADGRGATTVLRLFAACPDIPIVVITGDVSEETQNKCLRNGAQDFITKPVTDSPEDLVERLWYAVLKYPQRIQLMAEYKPVRDAIAEAKIEITAETRKEMLPATPEK